MDCVKDDTCSCSETCASCALDGAEGFLICSSCCNISVVVTVVVVVVIIVIIVVLVVVLAT